VGRLVTLILVGALTSLGCNPAAFEKAGQGSPSTSGNSAGRDSARDRAADKPTEAGARGSSRDAQASGTDAQKGQTPGKGSTDRSAVPDPPRCSQEELS
jgi:hypothetical protein